MFYIIHKIEDSISYLTGKGKFTTERRMLYLYDTYKEVLEDANILRSDYTMMAPDIHICTYKDRASVLVDRIIHENRRENKA